MYGLSRSQMIAPSYVWFVTFADDSSELCSVCHVHRCFVLLTMYGTKMFTSDCNKMGTTELKVEWYIIMYYIFL